MTLRQRAADARNRFRRMFDVGPNGPIMGDTQRFLLLSIIIGVFAGMIVVCFHISIEFLAWNTVHSLGAHSWLQVILWPALGGGVSFFLAYYFFPTARGSGVNYTKAALYVSDGYVPFSGVTGKFLCSTISIGTGNPMGPEDPALQMGAGVASFLGRLFHLSRDHMRLIAPVGAAAGIGADAKGPLFRAALRRRVTRDRVRRVLPLLVDDVTAIDREEVERSLTATLLRDGPEAEAELRTLATWLPDDCDDPAARAREILLSVAEQPSSWSEQLVAVRTVQSLGMMDLLGYERLIETLGAYEPEEKEAGGWRDEDALPRL